MEQRHESIAPMSDQAVRAALATFRLALADNTRTFQHIESHWGESQAVEKTNYTHDLQRLGEEFQREHDQINTEYLAQLEDARVRYERDVEQVTSQESASLSQWDETHRSLVDQADADLEVDKLRQIGSHEDAQKQRKVLYREQLAHCEQYRTELHDLVGRAEDLMRRRGALAQFVDMRSSLESAGRTKSTSKPTPASNSESLLAECSRAATSAANQMQGIEQWKSSRFADEGWPVLITVFLIVLTSAFTIPFWGWAIGPPIAMAIATVGGLLTYRLAQLRSRRHVLPKVKSLAQSVADASLLLDTAQRSCKSETRADLRRMRRRHLETLRRLDAKFARVKQESTHTHALRSQLTRAQADAYRKKLEVSWHNETNPVRQRYLPLLENRQSEYEQTLERRRSEYQRRTHTLRQQYEIDWQQLSNSWTTAWNAWLETLAHLHRYRQLHFTPWSDAALTPQVVGDVLPAVAFGDCHIELDQILEQPVPDHPRLRVPQTAFTFPALLSIPGDASLLLLSEGEGRAPAVDVVRNVVLRLMHSIPPGKFRLTVIDPTGLGQNFSELMHLADFDERLVRSRIWTEPAHIQQRMIDLTEHMENVIQKYLRNEYATIQEYNERAGEVAEPFQVLAIANFPANFTEEAAQRLIRIVSAGARCGVFTIMSTDAQLPLPRNLDMSDLKRNLKTLVWDPVQHGFVPSDPAIQPGKISLEAPPTSDKFNAWVRYLGQAAVDNQRVEVPFRTVMPRGGWWQEDCAEELEIPIGRVGATRLQHLNLGRGTAQHVLLAGKTGSGKSTLLHAMITNAAIHYSPAQLQFYLIDFKKGVEFKPYARFRLPHARIIAIESEREFGLSVLERLDGELRSRGDRFREQGVQDLAAYRRACPDVATPRILLVIDEFQEFFVKEDKISQSAALLLDRLVRQGRAFGIHVLLGSQTLSGAYSLARSTIGQMAVRIALQCSETDAHMILSEDNDAARLLTRPGQAIYNDANGLFEGNHPFQVVWLSDDERRELLQRLQHFAQSSGPAFDVAPMIFEGNAAADPRDNRAWMRTLESPATHDVPLAPQAWLGAPIAIGPPPAAVLKRQSGSNLLLVGQSNDLAVATLAQAILGLISFSPRVGEPEDRSQCSILLARRAGDPDVDPWHILPDQLPDWVQLHGEHDIDAVIHTWHEWVARRVATNQDRAAARFLVIPRLGRLRALQVTESDSLLGSFSSKVESTLSTAQKFQRILKDGPAVGVHTLSWSEQLHELQRGLGRGILTEFTHRVLFPMNASDSSLLMDAPEATKLGTLRAIYYRANIGSHERFRPFAAPDEDWLRHVSQMLQPSDPIRHDS